MAENIAPTETEVTEQPAGAVIVSSPEEYLAERRKGTATGLISWRSSEDGRATEPAKTEAVKPASEAEKPLEPQTNEQVTSEEEQPKDPEQKEDPKPPEGEGKRKGLIEDVQKQRQRAQQAERERDEARLELEAFRKGKPPEAPTKPVEAAAAKETKAEAPKLEHPGKPPKFLSFDSIEAYDEATANYLEKLTDHKSALLKQELSDAYVTNEAEKEKNAKKAAEESEIQTLNQKFNERLEKSEKQFPDLLEKLRDTTFPLSGEMADIIRRDEAHGVAMANYLVNHPEESLRIAQMRRHMDIGMAMGDIRATVKQTATPAKAPEVIKPRTSNAPPPPVNNGGGGGSVGSTLEELATRAATDPNAFIAFKAKWLENKKASARR